MKATFCPSNYQPSGVVSFLSWSNPALEKAIREAFRVSPREDIVEIVIEREGIKAVFKATDS